MLTGILRVAFNILFWLLNISGTVLFIYAILTFVLPNHAITQTIGRFIEPLLEPVRKLIRCYLPSLSNSALDFSPLGLWLLLKVASWLLRLLQRILIG